VTEIVISKALLTKWITMELLAAGRLLLFRLTCSHYIHIFYSPKTGSTQKHKKQT